MKPIIDAWKDWLAHLQKKFWILISGSVEVRSTHVQSRRSTEIQMSRLSEENSQSSELQRSLGKMVHLMKAQLVIFKRSISIRKAWSRYLEFGNQKPSIYPGSFIYKDRFGSKKTFINFTVQSLIGLKISFLKVKCHIGGGGSRGV